MYKFLYYIYNLKYSNSFLNNWIPRIIIRITNIIIPFCFSFGKEYGVSKMSENGEEYIISLTSFPGRIEKVWLTIETVLRQDDKPNRIVLWLFKDEFKDKRTLPKKLLKLVSRGLEIKFCDENLMPHKKYYYTLKENPDANIITIDDDFLYPLNMVTVLKKFHRIYPNDICCILTRRINIKNNKVQAYNTWNYMERTTKPSFLYLTMGGGGTLFPKGALHKEALNIEAINRIALTADDLWLKIMSLKGNRKVIGLGSEFSRFFIPILNKYDHRLMDTNIGRSQNDIIFHKLMKAYSITTKDLLEDNKELNN